MALDGLQAAAPQVSPSINTTAEKTSQFAQAQQEAGVTTTATQTQQADAITTVTEAAPPPEGPQPPEDAKAQLKAAYDAADLSRLELAVILGCDEKRANNLLNLNSDVRFSPQEWARFQSAMARGRFPQLPQVPTDAKAQLKAAYDAAGLTRPELAAILGCSENRVTHLLNLNSHGLFSPQEWARFQSALVERKFPKLPQVPTDAKAQLRAAYEAAGLKPAQLATILDCDENRATNLLNLNSVARRLTPQEWARFQRAQVEGQFPRLPQVPMDAQAQLRAAYKDAWLTRAELAALLDCDEGRANKLQQVNSDVRFSPQEWQRFQSAQAEGRFPRLPQVPEDARAQLKAAYDAAGLKPAQLADILGCNDDRAQGLLTPIAPLRMSPQEWAHFQTAQADGRFPQLPQVPTDAKAQLKAAYDAAGLTRPELAAILGCSENRVTHLLNLNSDVRFSSQEWARFQSAMAGGRFPQLPQVPTDAKAQLKAAYDAAGLKPAQLATILDCDENRATNLLILNSDVRFSPQEWARFQRAQVEGQFPRLPQVPMDAQAQLRAAYKDAWLTRAELAALLDCDEGRANKLQQVNSDVRMSPQEWAHFQTAQADGRFPQLPQVPEDAWAQLKATYEAASLTRTQLADILGCNDDRAKSLLSPYGTARMSPQEWQRFQSAQAEGRFPRLPQVPEDAKAQLKAACDDADLKPVELATILDCEYLRAYNLVYFNSDARMSPQEWSRFLMAYHVEGLFVSKAGAKPKPKSDGAKKTDAVPTPAVVSSPEVRDLLADMRVSQGQFEDAVFGSTPEVNQGERTQMRNELNKQFESIWARVQSGDLVLSEADAQALRQAELDFVFSKIYNPAAKNLIPAYGAALNTFITDLRTASQEVDPILRGRRMAAVIGTFNRKIAQIEATSDEAVRRADAGERKETVERQPRPDDAGPHSARYPNRMSPAEAAAALQGIITNLPGNGEHADMLQETVTRLQQVDAKLTALQSRVVPAGPVQEAAKPQPVVLSKEEQAQRVTEDLFKLRDFLGMSDGEKVAIRQLILDIYQKAGARMSITSKNGALEKIEVTTTDRPALDGVLQEARSKGTSRSFKKVMGIFQANIRVVVPKPVTTTPEPPKPAVVQDNPAPDFVRARKERALQGLIDDFRVQASVAEAEAGKAADAGDETLFETKLAEAQSAKAKADQLEAQLKAGDFSAIDNNPVEMRLRAAPPPSGENIPDRKSRMQAEVAANAPQRTVEKVTEVGREVVAVETRIEVMPKSVDIRGGQATLRSTLGVHHADGFNEASVREALANNFGLYDTPYAAQRPFKADDPNVKVELTQVNTKEGKVDVARVTYLDGEVANVPLDKPFLQGGSLYIDRSKRSVGVIDEKITQNVATVEEGYIPEEGVSSKTQTTDRTEALERALKKAGAKGDVVQRGDYTEVYPALGQSQQDVRQALNSVGVPDSDIRFQVADGTDGKPVDLVVTSPEATSSVVDTQLATEAAAIENAKKSSEAATRKMQASLEKNLDELTINGKSSQAGAEQNNKVAEEAFKAAQAIEEVEAAIASKDPEAIETALKKQDDAIANLTKKIEAIGDKVRADAAKTSAPAQPAPQPAPTPPVAETPPYVIDDNAVVERDGLRPVLPTGAPAGDEAPKAGAFDWVRNGLPEKPGLDGVLRGYPNNASLRNVSQAENMVMMGTNVANIGMTQVQINQAEERKAAAAARGDTAAVQREDKLIEELQSRRNTQVGFTAAAIGMGQGLKALKVLPGPAGGIVTAVMGAPNVYAAWQQSPLKGLIETTFWAAGIGASFFPGGSYGIEFVREVYNQNASEEYKAMPSLFEVTSENIRAVNSNTPQDPTKTNRVLPAGTGKY